MRSVVKIINKYDLGTAVEDFSRVVMLGSNENPYEPSNSVKKAYIESLNLINRYPDASYSALKCSLAEYVGVNEENIAVGCGASELISCVCNSLIEELDRVVIPVPSYTLYAIYSMLRNADIVFLRFENYEVDADVIAEYKPKLTFICSPNNPTGNTVDIDTIAKIAEYSEYVVVDEAYAEFCGESCVDLISDYKNLVILRTLSKFFGLAGLRVGYAVASKEIAEALEKVRLPFAISSIAVRVAIAAIKSLDYYKSIRDKIVKERERVFEELLKINFLKPYPSKANFILAKVLKNGITKKLAERGIVVRDVTGLIGLEGEHIRITIGKPEENKRLLKALKEISQT